MKNRKFVMKF